METSGFVVLHVPVDGDNVKLVRVQTAPSSLAALQELVGGDVEAVSINGFAHAYVDEEALLKPGARPNQVFNAVLKALDAPIASEQWVAGSAVIFGPMDRSGYESDVDPRVVSLVRSMGVQVSDLNLDGKYIDC